MKKLFLALSTAALLFGLGACGNKKASSTPASSASGSGSASQSTGSSSSSSSQGGGGEDNKIYLYLGVAATFWGGKLAYVGEGGGFFAYFFDGGTSAWPGALMTEVSEGVYSVDKQNTEHVIFSVNAADGSWGGDCQTVDLDLPTDGKNLFTLSTATEGSDKQNGDWSTYAA